jgi:hypothetical protein
MGKKTDKIFGVLDALSSIFNIFSDDEPKKSEKEKWLEEELEEERKNNEE